MKKRSFFRRRSLAADPNGKEPKPSRRHFGRVATMQQVRPAHQYEEDDYATPPMRRAASEDNLSNVRQLDNDEPPLVDEYVDEEHLDLGLDPASPPDDEPQPKLERGRSSKSQRHLKKRNSGKRTKEHRERDQKHRQRDDDAALLIELNKLLDTLTSRELQLSLRVDKADEAVRDALARRENTTDIAGARKRALCALKHKRLLERSLAVTTAQSDRVLRMLGHNVLTPLGERIEAAAQRQRNNLPDDIIGDLGVEFDAYDEEQILREIDATIGCIPPAVGATATANAATTAAPASTSYALDPAESTDWLAEVREQYAQRNGTSDRESMKPALPQRRDKPVDHQVHGFETVPEPDPTLKPRLSRESRGVSVDREATKSKSRNKSPRSATFSRPSRRRRDKERM